MKFRVLKTVALMLCVVLACSFSLPFSPEKNVVLAEEKEQGIALLNNSSEIDVNMVYASRFLNMLNHNFVYGSDFLEVEDVINSSMPALVKYSNPVLEGFIEESYVADYIFNMYGIDFVDFKTINSDFEQLDGYVYIIPRGYSVYNHEIISISENEDGSFSVLTSVEISSHDGETINEICETLFVINEQSPFGFAIISSNFGANALSI
ncbi:MAG: hypothetical protein IJP34_00465 [Clostridia bacterium]|nr:hypothetical protein [Clostridia bacterium]